ncbi:tRNA-processing RNAse BN [Sphaerotilus hippei]|uniref:UPF0761 membrane protein C7444_10983 n=1 Tax=Sphaerotilus hippei TaxID=744406 RepID=A0A318H3F0_9BURK|nr:YihY family inner membrane protein [Sphaerotilus hippei]PXW95514.1 tRNA-processing RNAse BN [Sphaerotilus hippei]
MRLQSLAPADEPDAASSSRRRGLRWREFWSSLQTWPWRDTLRTLHQRFREDRLGITASSLTFTTTIALVPLVTVAFAVFTAFPMFGTFRRALELYLIQNLVPDEIARPVLQQLTLFASKAHRAGALGLVVLGLTALALLLTIDRSLNAIWRVRQPRSIAQRVLVYWAIATLGPLLLGASLSLTSYAVSASRGFVSVLPGGVTLVLNAIELVLMAIGMAGLFRYVPNTPVRWSHALMGGSFVAVAFELAKRMLAWYLSLTGTYSTIYGAFATVPILLTWIYLGWVIVLLGAVVTAYAPSLQMRVVSFPATPGWRFALVLAVLRQLDLARSGPRRGCSVLELSSRLRIDPVQVDPVLERLMQMDWVGRLEEEGDARHVLLVDPGETSAAPLIVQWLLAESPSTQTVWRRAGFSHWSLADMLES